MLAILGGFLDDEISSGSSDDSDQFSSKSKPCGQVPKPDDKTDADETGARDPVPSQQFLFPGVSADNTSGKSLNAGHTAGAGASGVDKTNLCISYDQLKKFQNLQAKHVQAVEEKVPEGYRRRRRRKRRQHQHKAKEDECGCPSKKHQTDQPSTDPSTSTSPSKSSEAGPSKDDQEHWDTLKEYLNVNSHISQGVDHGHLAPDKSGLEKRLDDAIAEGDFERAEKLSEDLSTRNLGCKIAKAANARDYMKWKLEREEEKAAKKRKKKKKLAWGFEVKNRWEMKANM